MLKWFTNMLFGKEEPAFHITLSRQTSNDGEVVQISCNAKASESYEVIAARLKLTGDLANSRVVWHNHVALAVEKKIKETAQSGSSATFKKLEGNA